MRDFKFFQKDRVFSEWMDSMDDYFLGGIHPTHPYERPVNPNYYRTISLNDLVERVRQTVADPNYVAASHIIIPINQL